MIFVGHSKNDGPLTADIGKSRTRKRDQEVAPCYSVDLKCSPQAHVLKAWSPGWCYWEVVETLGGGTK
jgi:hypothetical protein